MHGRLIYNLAVPELPEVQTVRRSIAPVLVGQTIRRVHLYRAEVVTGSRRPQDLLLNRTVTAIDRHGKQLLIRTDTADDPAAPCVCIHLGMTGSVCHRPALVKEKHTHVAWELDTGAIIAFRDPRRFGGIWTFASPADLHAQRWSQLGPDALVITPAALHAALQRTRRNLKAALLDQTLVAGLGNIYVDELLFACRLHPQTPAHRLKLDHARQLVRKMRPLLHRAIKAGGSTVRDYVNGRGEDGWFQLNHQVYGRTGQPCSACQTPLATKVIAGRTTVFCKRCQPRSGRSSPMYI